MSKDLKKTIIYSLIPAVIFLIISSFIGSWHGCEIVGQCDRLPSKYYGYPLSYLGEHWQIIDWTALIIDFVFYYFIFFTILFIARLFRNFLKQRSQS